VSRRVQHLSLHRIAGTELRVISDVERQVLPLIEAEETVIRGYMRRLPWPHREVTLFILQDFAPLMRQLQSMANLDMAAIAGIQRRPAVNVYDLSNARSCQIFMNWQAMEEMGALGDPLAAIGLLAHEHAHPLSDNETTRASRGLRLDVAYEGWAAADDATRGAKVTGIMAGVGDRLSLYAAREIFANDLALRADKDFATALLSLDLQSVAHMGRSLAGRETVRRQLDAEAAAGAIMPQQGEALLLVGDLDGYMDMAMEVASFDRAGADTYSERLEQALQEGIFSHLERTAWAVFGELRRQYVDLSPAMSPDSLMVWSKGIADVLLGAVEEKGLKLRCDVGLVESGDAE
jgi:hypothetical protein